MDTGHNNTRALLCQGEALSFDVRKPVKRCGAAVRAAKAISMPRVCGGLLFGPRPPFLSTPSLYRLLWEAGKGRLASLLAQGQPGRREDELTNGHNNSKDERGTYPWANFGEPPALSFREAEENQEELRLIAPLSF